MKLETDYYPIDDGTEFWIVFSKTKYQDATINDTNDTVQQIRWCEEQFARNDIRWNYHHDSFVFSNRDDFTLFMLTWSDDS
jgi:hypothetical protein